MLHLCSVVTSSRNAQHNSSSSLLFLQLGTGNPRASSSRAFCAQFFRPYAIRPSPPSVVPEFFRERLARRRVFDRAQRRRRAPSPAPKWHRPAIFFGRHQCGRPREHRNGGPASQLDQSARGGLCKCGDRSGGISFWSVGAKDERWRHLASRFAAATLVR